MTAFFHRQLPSPIRSQCTVVAPACAALTVESPDWRPAIMKLLGRFALVRLTWDGQQR